MPGNFVNCHHHLYQEHPDHADFYTHFGMKAQSYMSHLSKILCIMPHIHQSIHRPSCSQHIFHQILQHLGFLPFGARVAPDPTHLLEAPYDPKISSWRYTNGTSYTQPSIVQQKHQEDLKPETHQNIYSIYISIYSKKSIRNSHLDSPKIQDLIFPPTHRPGYHSEVMVNGPGVVPYFPPKLA